MSNVLMAIETQSTSHPADVSQAEFVGFLRNSRSIDLMGLYLEWSKHHSLTSIGWYWILTKADGSARLGRSWGNTPAAVTNMVHLMCQSRSEILFNAPKYEPNFLDFVTTYHAPHPRQQVTQEQLQ